MYTPTTCKIEQARILKFVLERGAVYFLIHKNIYHPQKRVSLHSTKYYSLQRTAEHHAHRLSPSPYLYYPKNRGRSTHNLRCPFTLKG